ncbi:hypothetical protein JD276_15325 [Leucobacter sp. CSA1]|uniref:Uncharacterized protein n=1 Tax=Leucobacter chromiisoli TaxID=2796471 RepID=A0A934QC23_9MICO|nr:hypothetical protein [Leucobacter chromiisoli]MBK0420399.1 hypothetical protein [Leucobacter chromiisoli]
MSGVPASAESVLPAETPVLGGAEEAGAAASYARGTARDAQVYGNAIRAAQNELAMLTGDGVSTVRSKLADRLEPGAAALQRCAVAAETAFEGYASEIDRIRLDAARIERDVEDHLDSIRARSAEIETVAEAIRAPGSYPWRVGPPTSMPEPVLGPGFDDFDEVQRRVAAQDLRAMYEQQWRVAVADWLSALDGIRIAEIRWRTLLSERRAAERRDW